MSTETITSIVVIGASFVQVFITLAATRETRKAIDRNQEILSLNHATITLTKEVIARNEILADKIVEYELKNSPAH